MTVSDSVSGAVILLPEGRNSHMAKRFSKKVTIPVGLLIWLAASFLVDLSVLQIFPVPDDLWRQGNMNDIIASRPTAALALIICGQLIMLGLIVWAMTRLTKHGPTRAALILTGLVMTFTVVNTLLTKNFRWPIAVGIVLVPLVGYVGTRLGQANLSDSAPPVL